MPKIVKQVAKPKPKSKGAGVLDRIQPVSEWGQEATALRINIFGRNGTGKTTVACSFPKPLLLVGFEDGTKSVNKVKGVDYVRIAKTEEVFEIVEMVHETGKYKTVVADTATSLQDLVLMELLGLEEVPVQLAWGTVTQTQYRQRAEKTKELLRKLMQLPSDVHSVILAQEKNHTERDDEGSGEIGADLLMPFIASSLGKSTAGWLCENVDYICQTYVREEVEQKEIKVGGKATLSSRKTGKIEFCLRTARAHPIFASKIRADKELTIPDLIVDPTYDKLAKALQGIK